MGCVGGRQKSKNEHNLFIKLQQRNTLKLKGIDENNLQQVQYIRLCMNGVEVNTEYIQNIHQIDLEAVLQLADCNQQSHQLYIEVRQTSLQNYQQNIKNNQDNIQLNEEESIDICLGTGVMDMTQLITNPGKWLNEFSEIITSSGTAQILGGLRVQSCFYLLYPGDSQVAEQLEQQTLDNQYILRDIKELLASNQLDTVQWPHRQGIMHFRMQGMRLNGVHVIKGDFNFWGEIEMMGQKVCIDDIQQLVLEQPIQIDLDIQFHPLNLQSVASLRLYHGEREAMDLVATFQLDLQHVIKKHGQWSQQLMIKGKWESEVEQEMQDKESEMKVVCLFSYNNHKYGVLPTPPEHLATPPPPSQQIQMNKGALLLYIQRARALLPCDHTGYSDPYVEFYTSANPHQIHCTHAIEQTLDPVWAVKRKINLKLPKDPKLKHYLHMIVWDRDPCGQDLIGKVDIDISSLVKSSGWIDGWQKLSNEQMLGKPVGDIYLQIGYKPQGKTNMAKKPTPKY